MLKIYPYMNGSKSVRALADALGCKIALREGKILKGTIINWGASQIHRHMQGTLLNYPNAVANAANKLSSFKLFAEHDVPTVEWTTEHATMMHWLAGGDTVVFRRTLTGHSGAGIEIVHKDTHKMNEIVNAPLYTKYTKKKDEYRIHVFQGKVIFQQRKARKKDVADEQVNWQVRNLAGGFIFANDNIEAPGCVSEAAILAVQALGLDFGAADVGFHSGKAVVYEVNTACGLMGKTLEAYAEAIKNVLRD